MYIHVYIQVELRCDRNMHVGKSYPDNIIFTKQRVCSCGWGELCKHNLVANVDPHLRFFISGSFINIKLDNTKSPQMVA